MQLCAESQYKRRQRHDPVETLLAHSVECYIINQTVVMSNQVPVEQGDISFNFNIIKLWHMISVRAPALPHDPARRRCSLRVPG